MLFFRQEKRKTSTVHLFTPYKIRRGSLAPYGREKKSPHCLEIVLFWWKGPAADLEKAKDNWLSVQTLKLKLETIPLSSEFGTNLNARNIQTPGIFSWNPLPHPQEPPYVLTVLPTVRDDG